MRDRPPIKEHPNIAKAREVCKQKYRTPDNPHRYLCHQCGAITSHYIFVNPAPAYAGGGTSYNCLTCDSIPSNKSIIQAYQGDVS